MVNREGKNAPLCYVLTQFLQGPTRVPQKEELRAIRELPAYLVAFQHAIEHRGC